MGTHLDLDDVAAGHPLAQKELAELRKDAERYRWLRHRTLSCSGDQLLDLVGDAFNQVTFDRSIDAAMNGANT